MSNEMGADWLTAKSGTLTSDEMRSSSSGMGQGTRSPDDPGVDLRDLGAQADDLYATVNNTIRDNPALAAAACFAVGAALALVLVPKREPRITARRLEREMARYVNDMRQNARAEYRRSGWSDTLDRVGEWASTDNARAALQPWIDRAGEIVNQAREKVATTIQPK